MPINDPGQVVGGSSADIVQHEPSGVAESRARADAVIAWLRVYASDRLNSMVIDERRCIPPNVVLDFGNQGLLGLQAAARYGGLGLTHGDVARVLEQLAAIDLTLATFVGIHNSLGLRPIERYARPEAQAELLPRLASGRMLGGLAITEPGAGSNPRAIRAIARPDADGWTLDGRKVWIGNGAWAGVLNVLAKLGPLDGAGGSGADGYLGCFVRQGTPGLTIGPEALTMGMRGIVQNEVRLEGLQVPRSDALGEPGDGFNVAEDAFMTARLGIACMCVGAMRRCAQLMLRYASRRQIATGGLLHNPVTIERLHATMCAAECTAALTQTMTKALDAGESVPTGMFIACKIAGPELLGVSADGLIQVLGGRGYIESNYAPQLYRDARLFRIFEGPTETMAYYLGSLVANWGRKYEQYIAGTLGNQGIARSLVEVSRELRHRTRDADDVPRMYCVLGKIATRALLYACVARERATNPLRSELAYATEWAEASYEGAIARARAHEGSRAPSAEDLAQLVGRYEDSVGDVEQKLPGADYAPDVLLRKELD
jgi:alkylation response protein AidB-like acyl-CoA dehydrogenase